MSEIVNTAAEIRRAITAPNTSTILLDSGGFIWWKDEDSRGHTVLHGVATPARLGAHGRASEAFLNIMTPEEAVPYGPFRVIWQEASEEASE